MRGDEQLGQQAGVDIGIEVPGVAGLVEQSDHEGPAFRARPVVIRAQCRVALGGRHDGRHARREPRVGEQLGDAAQHAGDAFPVVVGVGRLDHLLEQGDGVGDELELAVPVAVDGGLADAGPAGDALDRERPVPDVGELVERGLEDHGARSLDARVDVRRTHRFTARTDRARRRAPSRRRSARSQPTRPWRR